MHIWSKLHMHPSLCVRGVFRVCMHAFHFYLLSSHILFTIGQAVKPTVLIGTSGVGKTFTKEIVEEMAALNEVLSRTDMDTCVN